MEDHKNRTSVIEDTIIINLGIIEEHRKIEIGKSLTPKDQKEFISLLSEFMDVFAWSYKDMPGIDQDIVEHKLFSFLISNR